MPLTRLRQEHTVMYPIDAIKVYDTYLSEAFYNVDFNVVGVSPFIFAVTCFADPTTLDADAIAEYHL